MTDTLACITNVMLDSRPCTLKDQHLDMCDGHEYRYAEDARLEVATGRTCTGCVPRPATHGVLCTPCWGAFMSAVEAWPPLAEILEQAGTARFVQADNERAGKSLTTIPLSPAQVALDEVRSYEHRERPDQWVATDTGGMDAVRFTRAVRGALRSFPTEDKPRPVERHRCPECDLLALTWQPPTLPGDPVRIKCRNPACGYELDQDALDRAAGNLTYLTETEPTP